MTKYVFDKYLGNIAFPDYDTIIYNAIERNGVWEPQELSWIFNNVKEGDICINVGANVGYFSSVMSKIVGKSGKVYAIEANPNFEQYIKKNSYNIKTNNVSILMFAAGSYTGEIDLFINTDNCGDNRVFDPEIITNVVHDHFSSKKELIKVRIDKVDNLVNSDKVDIVLIDCQGWDHEVIRGMKNIISISMPKILTEFVPKWITDLGEDPAQILKEYQDFGYDLFCPDLEINEPCNPIELLETMRIKDVWFTNIYLKPDKSLTV